MVRKRQSQSRNGAVAENRAHRSARIAVHASQCTHRSARSHTESASWLKGTPANRHKDAQPTLLSKLCVADLRFLEAMGRFY